MYKTRKKQDLPTGMAIYRGENALFKRKKSLPSGRKKIKFTADMQYFVINKNQTRVA